MTGNNSVDNVEKIFINSVANQNLTMK